MNQHTIFTVVIVWPKLTWRLFSDIIVTVGVSACMSACVHLCMICKIVCEGVWLVWFQLDVFTRHCADHVLYSYSSTEYLCFEFCQEGKLCTHSLRMSILAWKSSKLKRIWTLIASVFVRWLTKWSSKAATSYMLSIRSYENGSDWNWKHSKSDSW